MSSFTEAERRRYRATSRIRRIWVYVAFVAWTVLLLWRMEQYHNHAIETVQEEAAIRAEQVAAESNARILALCERGNESRQGIRDFVFALVPGDSDNLSPRQQQILDEAEVRFPQKPCPPNQEETP